MSKQYLLWIQSPSLVGTHQLLTSHQYTINGDGPPLTLLLNVAPLSNSVNGQLLASFDSEHIIQISQMYENVQLPFIASSSSLRLIIL